MTMAKTFAALVALLALSGLAAAHGDENHNAAEGGAQHAGHAGAHAEALGRPGDVRKVDRTVEIGMSDRMRFSSASVAVKRGETVRFVVRNEGQLKHEMVLGSLAELRRHAALMRKFPEMEHADPNQVSVPPGQTGELVWQFTRADRRVCHVEMPTPASAPTRGVSTWPTRSTPHASRHATSAPSHAITAPLPACMSGT
jgi:uncharacterized cupredoxin-like copper-binding protein